MAKILLVEDNFMIQELVVLRLEIAGHDVEVARDGLEGMHKAQSLQPDLVLFDMHMPVMSGHEAVSKLRAEGYDGLIIALTASALLNETNHAKLSGCNDIITKPITEEFEETIEKFLHKHSAQFVA